MYCNICGSPVDDKDIFCRKCGNKLVAAPEEVVFNSSGYKLDTSDIDFGSAMREEGFFTGSKVESQEAQIEAKPYTLDTSEFVWDVHEFNKEERPKENVTVDWKLGKVIDLDEEEKRRMQAELDVQLQEEIAARKRAEAEAAEKAAREAEILAREAARAEREAAERAEAERRAWEEAAAAVNELIEQPEADARPATLEDIENDIAEENRDMKRDTAKIEKFYTFNRKNEEFQKLLDKEYERIRSKSTEDDSFVLEEEIKKQIEEEPETAEPTIVFEHIEKETAPEIPAAEPAVEETQEAPVYEPFDPIAHLKRAEEERNAALNYGKGAEDVFDNDELIRKFDTMELEKDVLELKLEKERKKAEQQTAEAVQADTAENKEEAPEKTETVKAQEGWGTFSFLDELFGAPQIDEEPAAETTEPEEATSEIAEATEISEEPETPEVPEIPETAEGLVDEQEEIFETVEIEPTEDEAEAPAEDIVIAGAAAGSIAAGLDILDEGKEKDDFYSKEHSAKEKKKGGVGRVVLIIVIILLIIELAVLGIKYLAPESSAAAFINEKMTQVVELFMNDEDLPTSGDVDQSADGESDVQQDADSEVSSDDAAINTVPSSDKNEVIVTQTTRNKNIVSIKANDSLKFDANTEYADSCVKTSKAITDNILHKDADGTVYYVDQEVIGTLIAFDSGWIDYVNNKNKAVFDLLKKDSNAYKNCAAFNKNVKKDFKLLEVGEIRASEKGYYVWAYEVIETTSGGKTTSDEFKWVYYMEADGGNMQIVDYFRF